MKELIKSHFAVVLMCATALFSVFWLANAYKNRNRTRDNINVTGLGTKDFTSDLIVWSANFTRKNMDLKVAYEELTRDREQVKAYLLGKGLPAKDIIFSSVSINKEFDESYDNAGMRHSTFTGNRLSQGIEVQSKDVEKVEAISREVTELINSGVELNSNAPQYYYTKLAELKILMIAEATRDARLRAEKIASEAGASLGGLRDATMGVFQITAQNSNEDYAWGGTFNASAKEKTASITMKLQFGVR